MKNKKTVLVIFNKNFLSLVNDLPEKENFITNLILITDINEDENEDISRLPMSNLIVKNLFIYPNNLKVRFQYNNLY